MSMAQQIIVECVRSGVLLSLRGNNIAWESNIVVTLPPPLRDEIRAHKQELIEEFKRHYPCMTHDKTTPHDTSRGVLSQHPAVSDPEPDDDAEFENLPQSATETDQQQRDRHRREQEEAAAAGDEQFRQAEHRIRAERAEKGNPYAVEAVDGGAPQQVLDTLADLHEREPEDATEALCIWEEQTGKDAFTGAAK